MMTMPFDDFETQITCEETEYSIASYNDPFGETTSSEEEWTNESDEPLEIDDFLNGELFADDGTLTPHAMELLASLDEQGAFV